MNAKPTPGNTKRYTVKEAAAYLGVSEPTIYRWMKEGSLSFFKIGGATRFSQDGLDALIEKSTGFKEAEAVRLRCAACGHAMAVEGQVRSTGHLYFKPDRSRFWSFRESLVATRARVCTACGYVQIFVDADRLSDLLPEDTEEENE